MHERLEALGLMNLLTGEQDPFDLPALVSYLESCGEDDEAAQIRADYPAFAGFWRAC